MYQYGLQEPLFMSKRYTAHTPEYLVKRQFLMPMLTCSTRWDKKFGHGRRGEDAMKGNLSV